jgi:hypothetical protein
MVISVSAHVVGLIHQRLSEHRAAMRPCPRTPNYFGYGRFTRGGAAWFDLVAGWRRGVRLLGPKRQIRLSVG